jgi:hypothetical protein
MIPVPSGIQVWLATGYTDMRNCAERTIMLSPRRRTCGSARLSDGFYSA